MQNSDCQGNCECHRGGIELCRIRMQEAWSQCTCFDLWFKEQANNILMLSEAVVLQRTRCSICFQWQRTSQLKSKQPRQRAPLEGSGDTKKQLVHVRSFRTKSCNKQRKAVCMDSLTKPRQVTRSLLTAQFMVCERCSKSWSLPSHSAVAHKCL